MPLKPVFDKAPMTKLNSLPLRAGLVRAESAAMRRLYEMTKNAEAYTALEGVFRLACIVTAKPGDEPVAARIKALLSAQKADGSFDLSFTDSVALLRAAWALYEYEARKPLLDHIARWCAYAAQQWDAVVAEDGIWVKSADLLELLENLYSVTGKAAVLSLCERLAAQTMSWSSILNTVSSQRPTSREISAEELKRGMEKENGSRDGYYTRYYRTNHAETLADGARSTMAKGVLSGSATELNATRNGWERLVRYHGAVCGGLTSDELLEGTSPAAAISTAALGAWAEALAAAAMNGKADWAFDAMERMAYNAMPASVGEQKVRAFQCVNTLGETPENCMMVSPAHEQRAMERLVRGYAALASSAISVCEDGCYVNLYIPGRYAVPVDDGVMVFNVQASISGAEMTVHTSEQTKAAVRLRMPSWSRNAEVTVNHSDNHGEVKNGMLTFDRVWHEGDVISVRFEQSLSVVDCHHQGKAVYRGPVLMALAAEQDQWQKAFVSASCADHQVKAELAEVTAWKLKGNAPADIPVLPETKGQTEQYQLVPYNKTIARIALFPGRKQG